MDDKRNPVVRENSYVQIQAFMVNELHLSGNELIVYAVIYGFSQDGASWFVGSRKYLADWCQTSEKSVTNNLRKLLQKGLLRKRTKVEHGCTFNDYQAVSPTSTPGKKVPSTGEESSPVTGEESSPHTLEEDNSSEDASISCSEIVDYLNEKTGRNFNVRTAATRKVISARLNEGYSVNDFKAVIDNMTAKWKGTDWEQYLRPSTLFAPSHFDEYLNTPKITTKKEKSGYGFDPEKYNYFTDSHEEQANFRFDPDKYNIGYGDEQGA